MSFYHRRSIRSLNHSRYCMPDIFPVISRIRDRTPAGLPAILAAAFIWEINRNSQKGWLRPIPTIFFPHSCADFCISERDFTPLLYNYYKAQIRPHRNFYDTSLLHALRRNCLHKSCKLRMPPVKFILHTRFYPFAL